MYFDIVLITDGPVIVHADILLRSMGPISELDMVYSLDCYFRQTWVDQRLSLNISLENVSLGIKILERIWHPDTVFYNGQNSYLHIITTPNKFLRISPDGGILYSQRLTIRANCMMNLKKFPLDIQQCPLYFGSFAYSTSDVKYKWRGKLTSPVDIYPHLTLSTFDLIGYPMTNYTSMVKGEYHSVLAVKFYLRRHAGYFIIQVYVPCALLVVLSWVSFWINREATADRIALGTTTVLTMTILGIENRNDFPKVSYITALDLYIAVCFVFVLSTTVEFAIVHSFTKYGTGEPILSESTDDDESEEEVTNFRKYFVFLFVRTCTTFWWLSLYKCCTYHIESIPCIMQQAFYVYNLADGPCKILHKLNSSPFYINNYYLIGCLPSALLS
ncbi:hypothetical protein LOTGIDRAFT_138000 [Lottia gigantea]|uniref:Neurotransmitter-gated ion-channel ligand-binding domain-containing protein n=1 Tax=Lottia gigantea TaxID=225164 RepID=V4AFA2_LOTGI|nr:hypothetical protein LOTGIDRAFT_138000 [Lottia gigantea]ESP02704.1 hypothetical protein LOTGIDRAFT_138000 [Lottia gigantea]